MESKELDKYTINQFGIQGKTLMGLASISIFQEYQEVWSNYLPIVLAGSGNNGGDGLALGYFLLQAGFDVKIFKRDGNHSEEYTFYLDLLKKSNHEIQKLEDAVEYLPSCNYGNYILIDSLLGIGFKPPLNEFYSKIMNSINLFKKVNPNSKVLSIDCCSGYTPNTNSIYVKADYLAEIGVVKTNSLYYRYNLEKYSFHPIGFPTKDFEKNFPDKKDENLLSPIGLEKIKILTKRSLESHKYTNGSATFIGGSSGMSGAIMISQNIFQVIGGGISKILTPSEKTLEFVLKKDPSVMVEKLDNSFQSDQFLKKSNTILIGPGLKTKELECDVDYKKEQFIIIDAGGLDSIKNKRLNENFLLTPHIGEFNSLTNQKFKHISECKDSLIEYCTKFHVNVLLKSHISIYCNPLGKVYYWAYPNPRLAVMGSGDLLGGILAFFIAKTKDWLLSIHYSLSLLKETENMKKIHPSVEEIKNYIGELIQNA